MSGPTVSIEEQLQAAGLELLGYCEGLASQMPNWRHGSALLEDLTAQELDALGLVMPKVRAQPGQVLIAEGDVGDWLLLVFTGTVDVIKKSTNSEASRLGVIKQGASVGEMSMFDSAPRYASCIAIQQVEAGVLTRTVIAQLIQAHPVVGAKLLVKLTQMLAQRLRNTSNQMVKLIQLKEGDAVAAATLAE
jgi:CRP/FNR family transcriptional regulator, cyclic AMP receptor protein